MGNAFKKALKKTGKQLLIAYGGHRIGEYLEGDYKQEVIVRPEITIPEHSELSATVIIVSLIIFLCISIITLLIVNACSKWCKRNRRGEIIPLRTYNSRPAPLPRGRQTTHAQHSQDEVEDSS